MRAPLVLIIAGSVAIGCGSRGVTAGRIEAAVTSTFANLIHTQQAALGLPPVEASVLQASTTCHKLGAAEAERTGSGSWVCVVTWYVPGRRGPLRDTYDVSVTTDGCYTATTDGAEAHVGGPTVTTQQGRTFTNLLYVFEGCFDTT